MGGGPRGIGGSGCAMPLRWGCGSCGGDSYAVEVIKKVVWRRSGFNEFVVWLCGLWVDLYSGELQVRFVN